MTNPVKLYRDLACKARTETLQDILSNVLNIYLNECVLNPAIRSDLERYKNYVVGAPIGRLVTGFEFTTTMPAQIKELLSLIELREHSQLKAPIPLLVECENAAAASGMNAKVLFEQACHLEKALNEKSVCESEVIPVKAKLEHLISILYQKFAELIVEARNEEDIQELVKNNFPSELSQDLDNVDYFAGEIGGQLDYLSNTSFFEKFTREPTLAKKLEYVENYHIWAEEQEAFSTELNLTLEYIASVLINKAYQSCKAKKQRLIDDPTLTVHDVNQQLSDWTKRAWKKHANTYLLEDLNELLAQDQKVLDDWNTYDLLLQGTANPKLQPAYRVAAIRYTLSTPEINPAELLASIAPSPPVRVESARERRDQIEQNHQGKRARSNSF